MNLKNKKDFIIILITVLWAAVVVLGWKNMYMTGLFTGIVLMILHLMLGASVKGVLSKKFFVYPILCWAVLWGISFYMSYYHANIFAGKVPDFTILGFHPSFGWTVLTYWLGGVATLTIGFNALKSEWLSEEDWNEFKEKINTIEEKEGGC